LIIYKIRKEPEKKKNTEKTGRKKKIRKEPEEKGKRKIFKYDQTIE